jgi:hypothetical protein
MSLQYHQANTLVKRPKKRLLPSNHLVDSSPSRDGRIGIRLPSEYPASKSTLPDILTIDVKREAKDGRAVEFNPLVPIIESMLMTWLIFASFASSWYLCDLYTKDPSSERALFSLDRKCPSKLESACQRNKAQLRATE